MLAKYVYPFTIYEYHGRYGYGRLSEPSGDLV